MAAELGHIKIDRYILCAILIKSIDTYKKEKWIYLYRMYTRLLYEEGQRRKKANSPLEGNRNRNKFRYRICDTKCGAFV